MQSRMVSTTILHSLSSALLTLGSMSCIKGHRTTSCGIPVCRTKIFWTVKRPGRPSSTCTCRYGSSGGCKCITAKSICPHKSKKGEKRTGECRCDEQGRFCCLLEHEHWNALIAQQKPPVDFYNTKEELEQRKAGPAPIQLPVTPYPPASPAPQARSCCGRGAPAQSNYAPFVNVNADHFEPYQSPQSSGLTPRFGFMGIGAPQGRNGPAQQDVLSWNGQAPPSPRGYPGSQLQEQDHDSPCCGGNTPQPAQYAQAQSFPFGQQEAYQDLGMQPQNAHNMPAQPQSYGSTFQPAMEFTQPAFNYERMTADYYSHQFPSAICQKCGLNGCTCKNCPATMQNFGTSSWAQSCRKNHAMVPPTPAPVPAQVQVQEPHHSSQATFEPPGHSSFQIQYPPPPEQAQYLEPSFELPEDPDFLDISQIEHAQPRFDDFDPDLMMAEAPDSLSYGEFLLSELDRPSHT